MCVHIADTLVSLEDDALALQLRPELVSVVDRAVVNEGDALSVVHVGVGVLVGFTT